MTGVLSRSVGDEILLGLADQAELVTLSGTSATVWESLHGQPRSLFEIVDAMAELHGVARSAIARDVEAFVDDLVARGLLQEVAGADA